MNSKDQYYRDHPCPSWADEKQWAKLLEKLIFPPEGGINYSELSVNEVKVLEGYPLCISASFILIHASKGCNIPPKYQRYHDIATIFDF